MLILSLDTPEQYIFNRTDRIKPTWNIYTRKHAERTWQEKGRNPHPYRNAPLQDVQQPHPRWNLRNRHVGRGEENNPVDHIDVPPQPAVVQDDPQPVAAARCMLHVPLPEPQQALPLLNTTQAHVVHQPVPVQSSTVQVI